MTNPSVNPVRLQLLLDQALRLPAAEREAYVQRAAAQDAPLQQAALAQLALQRGSTSKGRFFAQARGEAPAQDLAPELQGLHAGQRIGDFTLVRFLGKGGMGQVWEARQESLKKHVALKLLLPGRIDDRALELFVREARAGGKCHHPNLVATLARGEDQGIAWLSQELVAEAQTLADALDHFRGLDALPAGYHRAVATLVEKVARGMQAAHDAGVIHRDLKPQNILIGSDDEPRVADFGLARVTGDSVASKTGDFAGTYLYMSPEQVSAKRLGLDHRSDVFSLGVVLYELLTLQRPFAGDTGQQIAQQITHWDPPRADLVRSQCPRDLGVIAEKAMQKVAVGRYPGMGALADDLRRHLDNLPILAKPTGRLERAKKWVRRNPTVSATMATVLAGAAVAGALAWQNAALAEEKGNLAAEKGRTVEQFQQVSGVVRLKEAQAAQAVLWLSEDDAKGWPDKVEAMERWLAGPCAELLAQRPQIEATVAALRQQALPLTAEQVEADRRASPSYAEYEQQVQLVASLRAPNAEESAGKLEPAAARLAELEAVVDERRTWTFAPDNEGKAAGFLHGVLVEQLRGLGDLEAQAKADVELRLSWARQVGAASAAHPQARHPWAAVRAAIAKADGVVASTLYSGRPIVVPERGWVGLVPIGMNPVTKLWEFYDLRSAWDGKQAAGEIAIPEHRADGTIELTESTGLVFVLLPGGEVTLGSQDQDPQGPFYVAERRSHADLHEAVLEPFFLSRYELTQAQWSRLWTWDENLRLPSGYPAGGDNFVGGRITGVHPVENVDWFMSTDLLTRHGLRLPSEDEWEYGCRGGTTTPWQVAFEELRTVANLSDQTAKQAGAPFDSPGIWEDGHALHAPVGRFGANAFGLHDMHGNVAEWCRDGFRTRAGLPSRVNCGGYFGRGARDAQSSVRFFNGPSLRNISLGLRPARTARP